MRRRFRWNHFINQHSRRRRWAPGGSGVMVDCREELAVIADYHANRTA